MKLISCLTEQSHKVLGKVGGKGLEGREQAASFHVLLVFN